MVQESGKHFKENGNIDGGWAWLVLGASFMTHLLTYGMAWSTGVYNLVFLEEFHQPKSVTAWAGSLPTAMTYAMSPVAGILTNKYGCRPVIIAGGILSGLGLCGSFFAPNLPYLFFSFGIIAGSGYGIAYIPTVTAVPLYFKNKMALAAGIATTGIGIGSVLYPALIRWLINSYGWKQSFLILGAVTLNVCVCGAFVRPVKRADVKHEDQKILDISCFKKKAFLVLCLNNFLYNVGSSALYIHLTAQANTIGIDSDSSAYILSALGIANLIGRFVYGTICQHKRMNHFVLYAVSFTLVGITICLVPSFHTFVGLQCVVLAFGFISGCYGPLLLLIVVHMLGLERFASGYGLLLMFAAAGYMLGGPLSGVVYDLTDSYLVAFVTSGCTCILSGVIMIYPYLHSKRGPKPEEEGHISEKEKLAQTLDDAPNGMIRRLENVLLSSSMSSLTSRNPTDQ